MSLVSCVIGFINGYKLNSKNKRLIAKGYPGLKNLGFFRLDPKYDMVIYAVLALATKFIFNYSVKKIRNMEAIQNFSKLQDINQLISNWPVVQES